MKVVYHNTMLDRILEAKHDAKRLGKAIDFIELSDEEFRTLKLELWPNVHLRSGPTSARVYDV